MRYLKHAESRHAYLGAFLERLGRILLGRSKTLSSCKHPITSKTYSTRSLAMWTPVDGDVDASKLISSYEHEESRHAYLGALFERLGRIPLGLFKTITSCKHPIASRTYSTRSLAIWTPVDGDVDASRLISSYELVESRHVYLGAFPERLGRIPLRRAESFLHIR